MKQVILVVLSVILLASCYKKEDDLTPSEGTEEIFQIPQGEHAYDSVVVDWFNQYGFYALYIFEDKDLYWYNEGWLEGGKPDISTAGTEVGKPGDEEYVGYAIDMFDKLMLQNYPKDFIKNGMPLRVLFCSELWNCSLEYEFDENWNVISYYFYDRIWVYEGWDNIAVNGANAYITDTLTRADQLQYSAQLNAYFLERLAKEDLIPMPGDDFFAISTYVDESNYGLELFEEGYLANVRNADVNTYKKDDFLSYCRLAGYPLDLLNGEAMSEDDFEDGYNPPFEGLFTRPESTLCKQKYDIMVKHLKSLGIDMDRIQNPVEVDY